MIIGTCLETLFLKMHLQNLFLWTLNDGLLHSCIRLTADVPGDHYQRVLAQARHHRSQIDLKPLLKVFRVKVFKFRSKGCQGQVQDGVSNLWISDQGDVSLQEKGMMFQFRRTSYAPEIIGTFHQDWGHAFVLHCIIHMTEGIGDINYLNKHFTHDNFWWNIDPCLTFPKMSPSHLMITLLI